MSERIGIVTGGGDCPGLNAVIRAVAKAAAKRGWETIGFLGGYEGILEPQQYMPLDYQKLGSLLTRGGTILGTANRGRFSAKVGHGETRHLPQELIDGVKAGMEKLSIRGLVSIGGDGSLSIGQQLFEGGVPLVGAPKTIDNDLEGTLFTFGFDSAVACATDALDRLHTTAESHNRVMLLEVMGRYAGWIALYAGVSGGADVILIPEIPFTYDSICAKSPIAKGWASTSRWSSWPKARGKKAASSSRRPPRLPTVRPGWAASRPSWRRKSSSGRARRAACASWGTCNGAAAPPASTARCARFSAPKRWN